MEKRRRERINRSLEELKRLVLEAQNRDVSMLCQQKSPLQTKVFGLRRFLLKQAFRFCSAAKFKEMLKLLALFIYGICFLAVLGHCSKNGAR